MKVLNREIFVSQAALVAVKCAYDESRDLVDAEVQKRQYLGDILTKARRRLDDYSSLPSSAHEMFRFDVDEALRDYLNPLCDAGHNRTVAFCSASTSQINTHCEMSCRSALSIVCT